MTATTFTSREFNQASSEAKRAANNGPVFITDRGQPAHVLISIELYRRLTCGDRSIADLLALPAGVGAGGAADATFPALPDVAQAADLS
ncbi:MAG: type II toxin-antitoxin system prevent-host-death family antitoxin [Burkholderiaceae bacterium]